MHIIHLTPVLPNDVLASISGKEALKDRFGSGGAVFVYELAKAQSRLDHKVEIIYPSFKQFVWSQGNLKIIGTRGFFSYPFSRIDPLPIFNPFILKSADVIHTHQYRSYTSLLGAVLAKLFHKPIFITDHGKTGRRLPFDNMVTEFLCVSKFSAKQFPVDKSFVVYAGVNTGLFTYGKSANPPYLFYTGVIRDHKKQLDLIRAFVKLSKQFPRLELKLAGGIIQPEYLEKLKHAIPPYLKKKIHILGAVDPKELIQLYKECTVFVSCSSHELFGLSIAEAMACGKPVIAGDVGSISELINHNKNGLLVPASLWQKGKKSGIKDINKLTESIAYILNNPKIACELGKQARKDVLRKLTWEKAAKRTIDRYRKYLTV